MDRRKINLSYVFAGQNVGVKQVSERIWLVSFMQYDLNYFDEETCRLEPVANPFEAKVLAVSMDQRNTSGNVCRGGVRHETGDHHRCPARRTLASI